MKHLPLYKCFVWLIGGMRKSVLVAALSCIAISAVSCRSTAEIVKEVPVPVHDTAYIAKIQHDSTYIDRWHTQWLSGDTVFIHDSIDRWFSTVKYDTSYKYIEVPITIKEKETVEVKKPLTWFQKTMMWMGVGFILVIIGFGMSIYIKLTEKTD